MFYHQLYYFSIVSFIWNNGVIVIGYPSSSMMLLKGSYSTPKNNSRNICLTSPSNPPYHYTSYQTTIHCSSSVPIQSPKTVQQLQQIVKWARANGKTVKPFGTRHSVTDIICTEGIPISMQYFNSSHNHGDGIVTFGAGMEMEDANIFLQKIGRAFEHVPTFGGITIGGAIGTAAHGSSLLHPTSLSEQAISMTIIDGHGSLRVISDPKDLNAFRVHLGLLGILVNVTFSTVPAFKMTIFNKAYPESLLTDGTALAWAHFFNLYQIWWFPSKKDIVVSKGLYHPPGSGLTSLPKEEDFVNFVPPIESQTVAYLTELLEQLQRKNDINALYSIENGTENGLVTTVYGRPPFFEDPYGFYENPATGLGWHMMSNRCGTSCVWKYNLTINYNPEETSMAFDLSQFVPVIKMIKRVLTKSPAAFPLVGVFIRFSPPSRGFMAISGGRPTFTVEWTTPMRQHRYDDARAGNEAYQWIQQEMLQNYGGRPHFGKNGLYYFNPSILNDLSIHPSLPAFVSVMMKYDPTGTFLNKFGRRLLNLCPQSDIDPLVTRCAIQEYCLCSKNKDCGVGQHCLKMKNNQKPGQNFYVCADNLKTPSNQPDMAESPELVSNVGKKLKCIATFNENELFYGNYVYEMK